MLTIAFGIILAIVILAFLPQLLVIAASLIIGAFFIMLMILAWHDPMLYPFPIILAVIAGVALYTGCSGRCERNRREHVIRANPELFPLLSKEFAKDEPKQPISSKKAWLAIILISGMLNVVAWMLG